MAEQPAAATGAALLLHGAIWLGQQAFGLPCRPFFSGVYLILESCSLQHHVRTVTGFMLKPHMLTSPADVGDCLQSCARSVLSAHLVA